MDKANLILNSTIELVDVQEEGNGKGRPFVSRFLEPGIAHYKELGDILITKETLNKFIHTMIGCPVIIEHEDVTDDNADKLRVGVVSRVWFNEADGYFYCEGILTDPEAIDLVKNQGYNVSCAYSFVSDNTKKTHNGKEIDMEFIDGEFLHLALVKDPRYEGANIVVNKNDEDIEWITVKGNHIPVKKGQSKDEAVKEFLEGKKETDGKDKSGEPKDEYNDKDKQFEKEKNKLNKQGYDTDNMSDKEIHDLILSKKLTHWGLTYGDPGAPTERVVDKLIKDFPALQSHRQEIIDKVNEHKKKHYADYDDVAFEILSKKDSTKDTKDKPGDSGEKPDIEKFKFSNKGNPEGPISYKGEKRCSDYKDTYKYVVERTERIFENAKKERNPLQSFEANIRNLNGNYAIRDVLRDKGEQYHKVTQEINKYQDSFREKLKQVNNSIGEITMAVLNDLTDFIKKVVKNEKEEEMKEVKNEDKRKLIDEVGGILKGKVDEEVWRTVVGKLEKVAYEPSEDSKADNEDDEEKKAKNKCKNEEDEKEEIEEKEEKVTENEEEDKKEDKEDKAENKKVKNSMKDIVMGGSSQAQTQKLYTSRKERLEEGNKY